MFWEFKIIFWSLPKDLGINTKIDFLFGSVTWIKNLNILEVCFLISKHVCGSGSYSRTISLHFLVHLELFTVLMSVTSIGKQTLFYNSFILSGNFYQRILGLFFEGNWV